MKKRIILLRKNSDIVEKYISDDVNINNILYSDLKHIISESHYNKMESQCNWEFPAIDSDKIFDISLFGVKDGISGQENKTELPTPEDTDLYFGDIILIKSLENKIVDFKKKDYLDFYEMACGGFESINSSDDQEQLTSDTSDEEYIASEIEEIYNNTSHDLSDESSDDLSECFDDEIVGDLEDEELEDEDEELTEDSSGYISD